MPLPILGLLDTALDKIFPDKDKALEAKQKLKELEQAGELAVLDADLKIALAQSAINQEEAKSESLFKSGWRPMCGWICVFGVAYAPGTLLLSWTLKLIAWAFEVDLSAFPMPPVLDVSQLVTMLFGLLGLGSLRSYDKKQGK